MSTARDNANELVAMVAKALDVDPSSLPAERREGLLSDVEYWVRDNVPESDPWDDY